MLLTYCGFVRPIRGVVQVAKSQVSCGVSNEQLAEPQDGYRYSNWVASGASLVAFSDLLRSERSARVNA